MSVFTVETNFRRVGIVRKGSFTFVTLLCLGQSIYLSICPFDRAAELVWERWNCVAAVKKKPTFNRLQGQSKHNRLL